MPLSIFYFISNFDFFLFPGHFYVLWSNSSVLLSNFHVISWHNYFIFSMKFQFSLFNFTFKEKCLNKHENNSNYSKFKK